MKNRRQMGVGGGVSGDLGRGVKAEDGFRKIGNG